MNIHGIFKFDPSCLVTFPSLSREAAIKTTKIKLDLLTVVNKILLMKKILEEEYQEQFVIIQKQRKNACMIMINQKSAFK